MPFEILERYRTGHNIGPEESDNQFNNFGQLRNDRRFRDMTRISTPNYLSFLSKLSSTKSLLSQYHRKAMLYLQRAACKCCTAGSYGPVALGRFDHFADNIELFEEKSDRYIMLEDWALEAVINNLGIKVSEDDYGKILEDYSILRKYSDARLDRLVDLLDQYRLELASDRRDTLFMEMKDIFQGITNPHVNSVTGRKKDYESRETFFELEKRPFSFLVGSKLKKDLDILNSIFGAYLTLLTKKLLDNIPSDKTEEFVIHNFLRYSEETIQEMIDKGISSPDMIDYPYQVMPPMFAPDISVEFGENGHVIIIGEIHVSATVISNPMFEFRKNELVDKFVSAIRKITMDRIDFQPYILQKGKDFTHHIPINIQNEIVTQANKISNKYTRVYAYRSTNQHDPKKLLFFPLAIGRRLIYNSTSSDMEMWARDYLPGVVLRLAKVLCPETHSRTTLRESVWIDLPDIKLPRKITGGFVMRMMDAIHNWQLHNKLPDKMFIRYSPSRKPIFVDVQNPFLVYEMLKLSSKGVSISPYLPHNLWLRDSEGSYCSEFRYMVCPKKELEIFDGDGPTILYLPGYNPRLDELISLRQSLNRDGYKVIMPLLNYNRPFREICIDVTRMIEQFSVDVVIGFSFGGAVALNLSSRVGKTFVLNTFFERKQVPYEHREPIDVRAFRVPKSTVVISAIHDTRIDPANSESIAQFFELKHIPVEADHMFSDSQEILHNMIKNELA
ncbi:MAG: hypothetical protein V1837_02870 [Candidatus Woesearchaeota archaeon]